MSRMFEDFTRAAGGAFGVFSGVRAEMEQMMRQQFEHFCTTMNLAMREDMEAMQGMLVKSRMAEEEMIERIARLEEEVRRLKGASLDGDLSLFEKSDENETKDEKTENPPGS